MVSFSLVVVSFLISFHFPLPLFSPKIQHPHKTQDEIRFKMYYFLLYTCYHFGCTLHGGWTDPGQRIQSSAGEQMGQRRDLEK